MSLKPALLGATAVACVLAWAGIAQADPRAEKAACVAAHDDAQQLQSTQKWRAARARLLSCSSESCPGVVREDCARAIGELDAAAPSIVFGATDAKGDVLDVRVVLDGEMVAERIDGRSLTVDPGPHVARFHRTGRLPLEVTFVARPGEKNRAVHAAFEPREANNAHALVTPVRAESTTRRFPLVPTLVGGAGLLALGGGLAFRLSADAEADHLRNTCAPTCDASSRDALSDKIVASNVSLSIGAVALATAAVIWLVEPKH